MSDDWNDYTHEQKRAHDTVEEAIRRMRNRGYYLRGDLDQVMWMGFILGVLCGAVIAVVVVLAI